MINFNRLQWMYAGGKVKRIHTVPLLMEHTNAKHVYGTLMIAKELYLDECQRTPGLSLLAIWDHLLVHDTPESLTGDVPSPVKRASPTIKAILDSMELSYFHRHNVQCLPLSEVESAIVSGADCGDLIMSCIEERRLGNRSVELADYSQGDISTSIGGVYIQALGYISSIRLTSVQSLTACLSKEWEIANGR